MYLKAILNRQDQLLTSSIGFPMNLPLFHQVMVAGGRDPIERHSTMAGLETENGSTGSTMVTFSGKTGNKKRFYLLFLQNMSLNS